MVAKSRASAPENAKNASLEAEFHEKIRAWQKTRKSARKSVAALAKDTGRSVGVVRYALQANVRKRLARANDKVVIQQMTKKQTVTKTRSSKGLRTPTRTLQRWRQPYIDQRRYQLFVRRSQPSQIDLIDESRNAGKFFSHRNLYG